MSGKASSLSHFVVHLLVRSKSGPSTDMSSYFVPKSPEKRTIGYMCFSQDQKTTLHTITLDSIICFLLTDLYTLRVPKVIGLIISDEHRILIVGQDKSQHILTSGSDFVHPWMRWFHFLPKGSAVFCCFSVLTS